MKLKIIAVRDLVADVFATPLFVQNVGGAVRGFGDEIKRPSTDERPNALNLHPEDYDLFLFGEFDDEAGKFELLEIPSKIAAGRDYK